jgi:hypothetical protein
VWRVEASASNFQISISPPTTAYSDYGMFLGTKFGKKGTDPFDLQMSRAVGFLR